MHDAISGPGLHWSQDKASNLVNDTLAGQLVGACSDWKVAGAVKRIFWKLIARSSHRYNSKSYSIAKTLSFRLTN